MGFEALALDFRRSKLALAICAGTTLLLVAGCGSTDRARLDVKVDASSSSFPASWHVSVQVSHSLGGSTSGRARVVHAAHGADAAVFDLHGSGRYRIGATVEPRDHSTGSGCSKLVDVKRDGRYSATVRLNPDRTCTVVVRRSGA